MNNPLQKARDGAGSAWRKSVDGTKRTAGWVKGGVGGTVGKARSSVANFGGGASKQTASTTASSTTAGAARDGLAGAWDRVGGASLMQRARADSRIGAGLILGAILVVTWIAWTVYVWTENGSTAGLGVLVSWPAVLLALTLVAAPFVAAAVLVRRLAADREPALAGGAVPAPTETEQQPEAAGPGPGGSEAEQEEDAEEDGAEDEDEQADDEEDAEQEDSVEEDSDEEDSDGEDSEAA